MSLRRLPSPIRTPVRVLNRHGACAALVLLGCAACGNPMTESAATTESVLLLENVTVIDGTGAPARAGLSVVVTGERISAVGPAGSVRAISGPGAKIIDGSGQFLIPGLWDMHVHLGGLDGGTRAGPAFIAHGVTGVRDMGSPLDEILTLRDRWRTALPSGPRLVAAGPILQGPLPFELPFIRSVEGPAEARAAVDDLHRAGVDFIKVGDTVPPDAYRALVDRARGHRLPVAGHLPVGIGAADAALAGQRSIEHFGSARFHGLLLASSSEEGPLTRRVQALLEAARQGDAEADARLFHADLTGPLADSFNPQKAAALFRTSADRDTAHVPTLVALRSVWDAQAEGMTDRDRRAADRVWDRYREMVRLLREAGVAILAGTDQAPDGASLHRELELLVEAGLSPAEAIVAATSRPAAFLGLIDEVGTVEPGKRADLVLLDGDPLADIANTRRIAAVVVGGSLLDRSDLRRLVAGQPVATPFRLGIGAPGQSAPQPRQHRELVEPSAWPAELTRRWTVPVGQGYATPIIVGDRVFMFTRQNGDEVMTSLNAGTGSVLRRTTYAAPYDVFAATANHGPGPEATPLFAAGTLFTLGVSGIVSAFEAAAGSCGRHRCRRSSPSTAPLPHQPRAVASSSFRPATTTR